MWPSKLNFASKRKSLYCLCWKKWIKVWCNPGHFNSVSVILARLADDSRDHSVGRPTTEISSTAIHITHTVAFFASHINVGNLTNRCHFTTSKYCENQECVQGVCRYFQWLNVKVSGCLTAAQIFVLPWNMARSPSGFSLSIVFSVADQSGGGEIITVCQILYVLCNVWASHPNCHDILYRQSCRAENKSQRFWLFWRFL